MQEQQTILLSPSVRPIKPGTYGVDVKEILTPQKILRAAIYKRVSKEEQQYKYSLPEQESLCRQAIAEAGLIIKDEHIFQDTFSGAYWREREELQRMLITAKRHEFDYVFFIELDRLSRDPVHQEIILDELRYYGVEIISLKKDEHVNDQTAMGQMTRYTYGIMAREERLKFRDRSQRGIHGRIKSNKLGPRRRPRYGYDWDDPSPKQKNYYVINETTSQIVKRIATAFDNGMTIRSIAAMLTADGILTPDRKQVWNRQTVLEILKAEEYTGVGYEYKEAHSYVPGRGRVVVPRPEEERIPIAAGLIPQIISRELWERNQIRISRNKELSTHNKRNPQECLVRSMVYCGYCSAKMTVQPSKRHRCIYYVCHKRRNAIDSQHRCINSTIVTRIIDEAAWEKIITVIRHPELVEKQLANAKTDDPHIDQLGAIDRLVEKINSKIKNLTESLEDTEDKDTRDLLIGRLKDLAQQRIGLEEERDTISRSQRNWQDTQNTYKWFRKWCEIKRYELDTPDIAWEEKRTACEKLGVRVTVWRADHDPHFIIEVNPPEVTYSLSPDGC